MTIQPTIFFDPIPRALSDGFLLRPGHRIGRIHIIDNLPILGMNDNLLGATREIYRSTVLSLTQLAELCQNDDRKLSRIKAFYGISHLAGPLAERLGFDVFDIRSETIRKAHHIAGYVLAHKVGGYNTEWNRTKGNFKSPKEAIISRNKLVDLYGKK